MTKVEIINRNLITDSRGWFLKVIDGSENGLPPYTGEIYVTSALPGEKKGGHYHILANEWFTLICGKCLLRTVNIINDCLPEDRILDSSFPKTIFIPAGYAHIFSNIGNEPFVLVAYSDQLYKPDDTITYDFDAKV